MPSFNLKTTLIVDAVTCTALFLLCVFATVTVAALLGLPPDVVPAAGWIGLPPAALMLLVAFPKAPRKGPANLIAVRTLGGVAASLALSAIFAAQMTSPGHVIVA